MIEVRYHMKRHELSATGHAGFAEEGQGDIVCSAVTALMLTAAEFARHNGDAEIREEKGDIYVRCLCLPRWDAPVSLVFNAIAAGLLRVAQAHPDNVKFERYA